MTYAFYMAIHIFMITACLGVALALLLVLVARMRLRAGNSLWKFASLLTSAVGAALIIVILVLYCVGTSNVVDAMQGGFFNAEDALRHWFRGIAPR